MCLGLIFISVFIKKETSTQIFSYEFCKNFEKISFKEQFYVTNSIVITRNNKLLSLSFFFLPFLFLNILIWLVFLPYLSSDYNHTNPFWLLNSLYLSLSFNMSPSDIFSHWADVRGRKKKLNSSVFKLWFWENPN